MALRSDERPPMLFSQLEYFVALAREQHFGRAAASVFISPSTLSEAVSKLEAELGVPLVRRGRSFQGLTPEGELALLWARRMVADHAALADELSAARDRLSTRARFGVIPSGIEASARILTALSTQHPFVTASVSTGLTSEEIVARVRSYELDAGIIHPSAADGPDLHLLPLEAVRAVVVCCDGVFPPEVEEVDGEMLASAPLCLLEPHMRARQILDQTLQEHGLHVYPRIETDSVESLLSLVMAGPIATVVPSSAVRHPSNGLRVLPLGNPEVFSPLALVRIAEDPMPPIAAAFDAAAST